MAGTVRAMAVLNKTYWRVVFRGVLTEEMFSKLEAAGIFQCDGAFLLGRRDRQGRELVDYPLRVEARDADHAFVRLTQVLGDGTAPCIVETPTPLA